MGFYPDEESEGAEAEDSAGGEGVDVGCPCPEVGSGMGRDVYVH